MKNDNGGWIVDNINNIITVDHFVMLALAIRQIVVEVKFLWKRITVIFNIRTLWPRKAPIDVIYDPPQKFRHIITNQRSDWT